MTGAAKLSIGVACFVFAFKMKAFADLSYTSDLFEQVQLATSWMRADLLFGHCYGHQLSIHSYFFLLPLGFLAAPLGAPGLFVALAVAWGAACWLAARILRELGVPDRAAALASAALVAAPFAMGHVHDKTYGFHSELLIPPLALGLLLALLKRHLAGSLAAAALLVSVKEDVPLLVIAIALLVLVEERRLSRPALAVIVLALVALPILLALIQASAARPLPHNPDGFRRLAQTRDARDGVALLGFVLRSPVAWLASATVRSWLWSMGLASFGLVLLRPHALLIGLPLTLVAWLMNDRVTWGVRFAPSLAFAWCVSLLGFVTVWRYVSARPRPRAARVAAIASALVATTASVLSVPEQPGSFEVYTFTPRTRYTAAERAQADELFGRYRREAPAEEAVAASPFLFRYAHDRNLYWLDHLAGWPRPRWILADATFAGYEAYGLKAEDYQVLDRAGSFALHRRRPGATP